MIKSKSTGSFSGALFLLRQIWTISPWRIILHIFQRCFSFSYGAFYTLLFFRYFLNTAQSGGAFSDVLVFFAVFMCFGFIDALINASTRRLYFPRIDPVIRVRLQETLNKKALSVRYSAYENPKYFDEFSAASQHAGDNALELTDHVANLSGCIFALILNMSFAVAVDPGVLIVAYFSPFVFLPC